VYYHYKQFAWSYQQFVKKVQAILSLSTLTLISGFVSTDNFTPVAPGFYLVLLSSFCKTIALSKLVPVTINAIGASSAVPRIPTGTVFTLAPTNIF
jgi:hypothetical protein